MLRCPEGTTMKAASKGPATTRRCRPPGTAIAPDRTAPEAIRATRDDSGWKTDDPIPISHRQQHPAETGSAG